jgi:hypothetical protein
LTPLRLDDWALLCVAWELFRCANSPIANGVRDDDIAGRVPGLGISTTTATKILRETPPDLPPIFWIRAMLAGIPIAGVCLAAFFIWRFPLTQEKMAEIRAQLEARRGKV